jgi:hypothetical protein
MSPFQKCVQWSWLPTKMATKVKIEKRGIKLKKNLLCNYWANLNQTFLKWSLGGPLPKRPSWLNGRTAWNIFGREPSNDYFINIKFWLNKWFQTRIFLWEFPIGFYVKLSSAVAGILVGGMKCRTQFWKGTTQGSFQKSLVEIGSVVTEKIFF